MPSANMTAAIAQRLQHVREQLEQVQTAITALEDQLQTLQVHRYRLEGAQAAFKDIAEDTTLQDDHDVQACDNAACTICPQANGRALPESA